MAGKLGAALDRQAGRFVERQYVIIAVDDRALDHPGVFVGDLWDVRFGGGFGVKVGQRGHTYGLAGLQPGRCFDSSAIDAQLAFAAHLFYTALTNMGKEPPQPAIKALIGVVRGNCQGLHARHWIRALVTRMPATMAISDRITEAST